MYLFSLPPLCTSFLLVSVLFVSLTSKFVWRRIPVDLKSKSAPLQATWRLLADLHRGEFSSYYANADADAIKAALASPVLQQLNAMLRAEIHARNVTHIRRAYTTIGVSQAAALLGLTVESTPAFLTGSLQWTPDSSAPSQFFHPTPLAAPKPRDISTQQIEQITKYIAHLEE